MNKYPSLAYLLIFLCSCAENNPYKDRVRQDGGSTVKALDNTNSSNGQAANEENESQGESLETGNDPDAASTPTVSGTTVADTKTVADPADIPKASLSATEIICSSAASYPKFAAEYAVLCLNGVPTSAFANLLTTAFNGTGTPQPSKIKSVDVNGVSEFILATSFQVNRPIKTAFTNGRALNDMSFVEGNATFTMATVSEKPATEGMDLGSGVRKQTVVVKVSIITVQDISISDNQYVNLKDQMVISTMSALKPGEADNTDNILGNGLNFLIADGNGTKVVVIAHQQLNNRGQHAAAETTALAVARRMTVEGFNALSK